MSRKQKNFILSPSFLSLAHPSSYKPSSYILTHGPTSGILPINTLLTTLCILYHSIPFSINIQHPSSPYHIHLSCIFSIYCNCDASIGFSIFMGHALVICPINQSPKKASCIHPIFFLPSLLCNTLHKPFHFIHHPHHLHSPSTSLMSFNQYFLQSDQPYLVDPRVINQDNDFKQTKPQSSQIPPHIKQVDHISRACVDGHLGLLQTYQMEFDVDNTLGRLPGCFVREFGKTISEYVILRDPNHNEFEVHVVKKAKEMYFGDGWHSLVDAYSVYFGAWVTFTYVNPELLLIRLLTRSGTEVNYPCHDPPLRHLLARNGPRGNVGSSLIATCSPSSSQPKSFLLTYVKELTPHDIQSGTLFLPWYGFGQSAFAFVFSDLILVDSAGDQFKCVLKFGVDPFGELSAKVSGGWLDLCSARGVLEGDRVKFSVARYFASNVVYVSIYPRIGVHAYLNQSLINNLID